MHDVYRNIGKYNLNKKTQDIIPELFIKSRKLNISRVFITQSYFKRPKDVRLNLAHYFIKIIPNKRELYQNATDNFLNTDFQNFENI